MSDCVILRNGAAEATIHRHGATVISWKVNGRELLFCSKLAHLDGSKPIRGGIPLVFRTLPASKVDSYADFVAQFGQGDIMAGQHGFARTLSWNVEVAADGKSALCSLEHNEHTLSLWPYQFKLEYKVALTSDSLQTSLTVNNCDASAFKFTSLLHTYLGVPDISQAEITGFKGLEFIDKLDSGNKHQETREAIKIESEVDQNYISFPHNASLRYPSAKITITTNSGFPDMVLWNPWIEKAKALSDFGDEEYKEMVCMEAGKIIEPVWLEPNQSWTASQTLSVAFDN